MIMLLPATPGREEVRPSMFSPWTPSLQVPLSVPKTSCHSHLAPNCLARHPHTWSKDEVRVWLEWCAGEYSIEPVAQDKFDMNGKALELLNRADFMERDPSTGDVLFNALQRLMVKNESSSPCAYPYTLGPPPGVPTSSFNHHTPCPPLKPPPEHGNGIILFTGSPPSSMAQLPYTTEKHQPTYVPIRPGPLVNHQSPLPPSKDLSPKIHIPESMLSPAPTTDTDSGGETEVLPEGEDGMDYTEEAESRHHPRHHPRHQSPEAGMTPSVLPDVPTIKRTDGDCRLLWEFIHQLLQETRYRDYVSWERQEELIFRIVNPTGLAELWGFQKNRTNMTYEKLSRALRYYYKMNIIKKVSGKRLTYQFLQHPRNIKKGQRGARPHSARMVKQETIPSPQPITEDPHNEANSPRIRDFHPEEQIVDHKPLISHHPVHNQHVDTYDSYDNQCDLQLIDGHLRPPLEEEDQEDHTVPHVKQEVPVQEEPEDLSMKPSPVRRLSGVDYAQVKEEHPDEDSHIKLENSS